MPSRTVSRLRPVALVALLLSCDKTQPTTAPSSPIGLASLAVRLGGNDRAKTAVLTDRRRALDSLYAARFGMHGELPLSEAAVMDAIDAAFGGLDRTADILDATRASHDLSLTPQEVAANAATIRTLYRSLLAYDVYSVLSNPSVLQGVQANVPTEPVSGAAISVAGHTQRQLWLLAVYTDRVFGTLGAEGEALSAARDYYKEKGEAADAPVYAPDGTRANSYQHALWNVLIVKKCGSVFETVADAVAWAKEYTDAHEGGSGSDGSIESDMDQHNNAVGQAIIADLAFRDYADGYVVAAPSAEVLKSVVRSKAEQAALAVTQQTIQSFPNRLVFIDVPLSVSIVGAGAGGVLSPAGSIDCHRSSGGVVTGSCAFDLRVGRSLVLSAALASLGNVFAGWSGDCTGVSCEVAMNDARAVVATFNTSTTFVVDATPSPFVGGIVTGASTYDAGATVTLTATPFLGFAFDRWAEGGNQISTSNPYEFPISGNHTIVAVFVSTIPSTYTILATPSPTNGGTVGGTGTFPSGSAVSLTAAAAVGYSFVRWTEGGSQASTDNPWNFNASASRTFVAVFSQNPVTYTVSATPAPVGTGTVTGNQGTYSANASASLTASPSTGYSFVNWTENGLVVYTRAIYNFNVTGNRSLVANFAGIAVDLLSNGGFEASSATDIWTFTNSASANKVSSGFAPHPRSGSGYAFFGASPTTGVPFTGAAGAMYQNVVVPSSCSMATLSFWYNITSTQASTAAVDSLHYTIRDLSGAILAEGGYLTNLNKRADFVYLQKSVEMNAVAYRGQTIRAQFVQVNRGPFTTVFRVDDVSFICQ